MSTERRGILAGGNFIVDHVKIVDRYPAPEMLANIATQTSTNGGGPYNMLTDLARMGVDAPLEAVGLVGDDSDGQWIRSDCQASGIDTAQLQSTPDAATSYTDVMSVASTGQRTFFHQRGANALLSTEHFDFSRTNARLFHLAYLLLLDRLDTFDDDGRSGASRVLESARSRGLIACADMVSLDHPDTARIVASAARHVDHLLLNEVEAARVVGVQIRRPDDTLDVDALEKAARAILALGVGVEVTIHCVEGALACHADTGVHWQDAVSLPADFNRGSVGAGDAFAAGYLWGVHEGVDTATRLRWAVCAAAMSLSDPTPSRGMKPLSQCLQLGDDFGYSDTFAATKGTATP